MECLAVKIIQSESRHFFRDKICGRHWVLVFLAFVVLREKINFKIKTLGRREKREEAGPKRKQFNDVCKVCQVNLKHMANLWLKFVEIYSSRRRENKSELS